MSLLKKLFGSKPEPKIARKTPPAGKIASAYQFPDRIVLHSMARTTGWALVATEPYITLPRNAEAKDAGCAVQTALAGFRAEIPESDIKSLTAGFVRGVGAKSHKQLQETSISSNVTEKDGRLEFQPYHNGGTNGDTKGFQPIRDASFSLPANATSEEIGTALFRCFALCTTVYDEA